MNNIIDFKNIEFTTLTEQEIIAGMDYNCKSAQMLRKEIEKLQQASHSITITEPQSQENNVCVPAKKQISIENQAMNDEVNYYLTEINNIKKDSNTSITEQLKKILTSDKEHQDQQMMLRVQAEILKNIKELKECLTEEGLTSTDLEFLKSEIKFETEKLRGIGKLITKSNEPKQQQLEQKEETTKNNLIFVPTSGGNIRVLEEIDHITAEYYPGFLGLFNSIKDGTFKNFKRLVNNSLISGVYEVKDHQIRVVFDRLDTNNYAIITAFVKKTTKDKGYIDPLTKKVLEYKSYSAKLKQNLQNEEFVQLHQDLETELYNKLTNDNKKSSDNSKVKKKGM